MKSFSLKIAAALSSALSLAVFFVSAGTARAYDLLEPLPVGPNAGTVTSVSGAAGGGITFTQYVTGVYQFCVVACGVAAVVMIIWGGFDYILTDKVTGKGAGKKKINNALIGLLIALSSYAILYTINPRLTQVGSGGSILPPIISQQAATK